MKENLFFNFADMNQKKEFKINVLSFLDAIDFLINNGVIKDFPEKLKSEMMNRYGKSDRTYDFNYNEIDTFDWKEEIKRTAEEQMQEKAYEEYFKQKGK